MARSTVAELAGATPFEVGRRPRGDGTESAAPDASVGEDVPHRAGDHDLARFLGGRSAVESGPNDLEAMADACRPGRHLGADGAVLRGRQLDGSSYRFGLYVALDQMRNGNGGEDVGRFVALCAADVD